MLGLTTVILAGILAGCGGDAESEQPGARGPVVFRMWDAASRAAGRAPMVIRTDAVTQTAADFSDVEMTPVLVRRPMEGGVLWIHSRHGTLAGADAAGGRNQAVVLEGPVYFSGSWRGAPLMGSAATARVPPGQDFMELTEIRLVRAGMLFTAPSGTSGKGAMTFDAPTYRAGSPAVSAVLGAVP